MMVIVFNDNDNFLPVDLSIFQDLTDETSRYTFKTWSSWHQLLLTPQKGRFMYTYNLYMQLFNLNSVQIISLLCPLLHLLLRDNIISVLQIPPAFFASNW